VWLRDAPRRPSIIIIEEEGEQKSRLSVQRRALVLRPSSVRTRRLARASTFCPLLCDSTTQFSTALVAEYCRASPRTRWNVLRWSSSCNHGESLRARGVPVDIRNSLSLNSSFAGRHSKRSSSWDVYVWPPRQPRRPGINIVEEEGEQKSRLSVQRWVFLFEHSSLILRSSSWDVHVWPPRKPRRTSIILVDDEGRKKLQLRSPVCLFVSNGVGAGFVHLLKRSWRQFSEIPVYRSRLHTSISGCEREFRSASVRVTMIRVDKHSAPSNTRHPRRPSIIIKEEEGSLEISVQQQRVLFVKPCCIENKGFLFLSSLMIGTRRRLTCTDPQNRLSSG
jgi:hypothetical protein